MRNKRLLKGGRILRGEECPFSEACGDFGSGGRCKCPAHNRKITTEYFSCGLARGFDISQQYDKLIANKTCIVGNEL